MGILDEIGSLLNSPALQELIPTVVGATGAALSSPRLQGTRGAIGHAMTGGLQGFEAGEESQRLTQNAQFRQQELAQKQATSQLAQQHLMLQDQVAQGNVDAISRRNDAFAKLPPAVQQQYGTPAIWAVAMGKQIAPQVDATAMKQTVAGLFNTAQGRQYLASRGITDPSKLPSDKDSLDKLFTEYKPEEDTARQLSEAVDRARLTGTLPAPTERPTPPQIIFGADGKPYRVVPADLPELPAGEAASKTAPKSTPSKAPDANKIIANFIKENPRPVSTTFERSKTAQTAQTAWNQNLKQQLIASGINPETYAAYPVGTTVRKTNGALYKLNSDYRWVPAAESSSTTAAE